MPAEADDDIQKHLNKDLRDAGQFCGKVSRYEHLNISRLLSISTPKEDLLVSKTC